MKALLSTTEVYRIDSEEEVAETIENAKASADDEGYVLKGYSTKIKEKKSKGEIIDFGYEVTLKKEHNSFWEV